MSFELRSEANHIFYRDVYLLDHAIYVEACVQKRPNARKCIGDIEREVGVTVATSHLHDCNKGGKHLQAVSSIILT